jgi:type II secretory pathway pseudopilin PulG
LVEVLVSVMIFSLVMTVALGALLSMSESNRRAESLKSVINNLNFALDSMSRTIRTGLDYHCNTTGADFLTPAPQDCDGKNGTPAGASYLALRAADGSRVAYCLSGGSILRDTIPASDVTTLLPANCTASGFVPLTSTEVTITSLKFIVTGTNPGTGDTCSGSPCSIQPKVTMLLTGSIKVSGTVSTVLNLQTSITQRIYDQ